jgi:hypothetical protein
VMGITPDNELLSIAIFLVTQTLCFQAIFGPK